MVSITLGQNADDAGLILMPGHFELLVIVCISEQIIMLGFGMAIFMVLWLLVDIVFRISRLTATAFSSYGFLRIFDNMVVVVVYDMLVIYDMVGDLFVANIHGYYYN